MQVRYIPRFEVDAVLQPDAALWQAGKAETVKLKGTPLDMQPSDLIKASWVKKKIGAVEVVQVAAVHDGERIAFRLEWSDPIENGEITDTTAFPDGCGILLPTVQFAPMAIMGATGMAVNGGVQRAKVCMGGKTMIRPLRHSAFGMLALSLLAASPFAAAASDEETIRALRDDNEWMRRQLEVQAQRLDRLESESSLPVVDASSERPVTSKFAITLTGFLKTDFLWNNARLNSTSAPRFAVQDDRDDDQFTGTVKHSRIIAKIAGPAIGEGRIRAYVETDLFNLFDTTDLNFNNNQFRLRQLYVSLDHPTWRVLLGQTWDLFSPLNVATLNTN